MGRVVDVTGTEKIKFLQINVNYRIVDKVILMTIRETTIAKLQQLPEPLLQEVNDFIDFITHKHQYRTANGKSQSDTAQAWALWFESVDCLEVTPIEPSSEYQQLLLNKYRQQGLEL